MKGKLGLAFGAIGLGYIPFFLEHQYPDVWFTLPTTILSVVLFSFSLGLLIGDWLS